MENETTADLGGQTDIVERSAGGEGNLSVRAAANSLVDTRRKDVAPKGDDDKDNARQQPGEARGRATAGEQESAPPGDGTGPDAVPGETQEADPEPKAPPIEPPRSWTNEDKERGDSRPVPENVATRISISSPILFFGRPAVTICCSAWLPRERPAYASFGDGEGLVGTTSLRSEPKCDRGRGHVACTRVPGTVPAVLASGYRRSNISPDQLDDVAQQQPSIGNSTAI